MSLSSVVPNGRFIALVTAAASFCQTPVWGFLQQHKIIPLYSIYQKGGKKRPILESLNLWYITRRFYVPYNQWPHTTALQALAYPLKEDRERFLLLE